MKTHTMRVRAAIRRLVVSGGVLLQWLCFTSCSSVSAVPGETLASARLQYDVLQPILALDRAADPSCKKREIANTEVLSRTASERTERWTLNRCGKLVRYLVTVSPTPGGGTDFQVRMDPGG